jgi:hypothetical protein
VLLRRARRSRGLRRDSWLSAARPLGVVYAVAGAAPGQGGYGSSYGVGARTTSAQVRHLLGDAEVEVETSDDPAAPEDMLLWRLSGNWMSVALSDDRPRFPVRLEADRWEQDVDVEGTPHRAVFVGNDTAWCASTQVGPHGVMLSARGWPAADLRLVRLPPRQVPEVAWSS